MLSNKCNPHRRTLLGWSLGVLLAAPVLAFAAQTDSSVIDGKDGWLFPTWESLTDIQKPRIDTTLATVAFVNAQLAARKITLVVMVAPMKASFYPERLPAGKPLGPDLLQRYAYVQAGLQAAGILTFDDLSVLRTLEQARTPAFYRTDYHWTAQAAEASAAAAAELIQKQVTFTAAPAGGNKLGEWANERRYGDLALRFKSAEQRVALGRDLFQVRASSKEKQSLLDEDPAEVHVVGNSFVQPYLGFPQKLSNTLNRPVSLTWNFGNVGPWATLLKYLESETYQQAKPRVIVWQLNEPRMQSGPEAKSDWDTESIMSDDAWRSRVKAAIAK